MIQHSCAWETRYGWSAWRPFQDLTAKRDGKKGRSDGSACCSIAHVGVAEHRDKTFFINIRDTFVEHKVVVDLLQLKDDEKGTGRTVDRKNDSLTKEISLVCLLIESR